VWQAAQKLHQEDASAANCHTWKKKSISILWPGQLPGSVALEMAMQAQIARRIERMIGLLLLAASTFILELMREKVLE